jgi:hypothetical protein
MAINLLGLTMVVLFWPETKGISLEHMDIIFGQVDMVEAYKGEHPSTMMSERTKEECGVGQNDNEV